MVSAKQVILHYTGVAEKIDEMLSEFGNARKVAGFWCMFERQSNRLMGCIYCPSENYCPMSRSQPILERPYNPDSEWHLNDLDDIMIEIYLDDELFATASSINGITVKIKNKYTIIFLLSLFIQTTFSNFLEYLLNLTYS